jgi:UDP-N-acetylmuramoyl-L-alanyl-D-glutamate--2,6-diaminopimelate ligase
MIRRYQLELQQLFQEIITHNNLPETSIRITGIQIDSRQVQKGELFIALKGTQVDGHDFILNAVEAGAAAVVGSRPWRDHKEISVPYLQVDDAREALAKIAAAWHGYPARELVIIGVTGTDGKTTTANLIYQILRAANLEAGLISTVNAIIGDRVLDTGFHVTTPEAMDVQFYLSEMIKAGINYVVLEATSHGLAQKRVATCEFDIGVVTNITHEHLDFHGDYPSYLAAKAELFRLVSTSSKKPQDLNKVCILNKDDQSYPELTQIVEGLGVKESNYGLTPPSDFLAGDLQLTEKGIHFLVNSQEGEFTFFTRLLGDYNVSNCLAAAAACRVGLGLDWELIQAGIGELKGIPGRMESLSLGQDFLAIVDFAHTPNALKRALISARELTGGQVIAVFGSAGLRDKEKRRLMAEISIDLADITILTAEDPRTESLTGILEEMAGGAIGKGGVEGEDFWRIEDRGEAIRRALDMAQEGDVVMICGKGHEQSMCFGEIEYAWDDRVATRAALAEYLNQEGPQMPILPTSPLSH